MFSWSNNGATTGRTSAYPAANGARVAHSIPGSIRPPDYTRSQHLDSYLTDATLKRSTRRVSADDTTYDTVFQTTSGEALIVRVHFPAQPHPSAPARAPAMRLAGVKASHGWLDSQMRIIGYEKIQSDDAWRSCRLLLGTAVHEVIKHLQLNPPQVLEITDVSLQKLQKKLGGKSRKVHENSSPSRDARHTSQPPQHQTPFVGSVSSAAPPNYETALHTPEVDMPTLPSNFPEVDSLSTNELQAILDDEINFLTFVSKLPVHKEIQSMRSAVLEENVKAAEENLETESRLKELHDESTKLQADLGEKLKVYNELETKKQELSKPTDTRAVVRALMKAKKEALEESEEYAEEWLDDGGDVRKFVKSFLEIRKVHHIRAAKVERLKSMGA